MRHNRLAPIALFVLLILALTACSAPAATPTAAPVAPAPTMAPASAAPAATAAPAPTAVPPTAAPTELPAAPTAALTPAPTAAATEARSVTVFAAASLTESFKDIGAQFEAAHPGAKMVFNFAGSQQLSAQLAEGAPADVFASANTKEMQTVIKAGVVVSGTQKTFARNRLAVIFPKDNPGKIATLADLAKAGIKLDFEDKSVPAGQYTLDMLAKMSKDPAYGADFSTKVLKNVVSYETDVKSVVSKISLGEADAGVVYTTDAAAAADKLGMLAIPDQFNQLATYPIAAITKAPQPELAKAFVDFVLGDAGQQTLAKYGFISPKAAQPAAATPAPSATITTTTVTTATTASTAAAASVTVTDQSGKQVTIKQPVQRIVSAYSMASLYVYAVGAGSKLVAGELLMSGDPAIKKNIARLTPDATKLTSTGGQKDTSIEAVAKANPDLILNSVRSTGQDTLDTLGVPVVRYQGETTAKLMEAITITGKALGLDAEARATKLVAYMTDRLAAIKAVSDKVPADQRKRVLVSGTSPLKVAGKDMLQSEMVELAGGTNVAKEVAGYWPEVNLEQITKWDPEIIFVVPYKGASVEALLTSPEWANITAVKNKQVFMLPKYLGPWDTPIPEAILGIEWMAGKLFPDTPLQQGCADRMTTFYKTFYDLDVPADDATTTLCK